MVAVAYLSRSVSGRRGTRKEKRGRVNKREEGIRAEEEEGNRERMLNVIETKGKICGC